MKRRLGLPAGTLALAALLQACSGGPPVSGPARPPTTTPTQSMPPSRVVTHRPSELSTSRAAERIVHRARQLIARPYRWGGSDPSGFDCSGFTRFVLASVGVELPRTTVEQARAGRWKPPDELTLGDLVFFGTDRTRPFHVGLVVSGAGQPLTMIHASTSRGVIETEIVSNSYWLPRLTFGRRVLPD